jgi:hypothetical protein
MQYAVVKNRLIPNKRILTATFEVTKNHFAQTEDFKILHGWSIFTHFTIYFLSCKIFNSKLNFIMAWKHFYFNYTVSTKTINEEKFSECAPSHFPAVQAVSLYKTSALNKIHVRFFQLRNNF